MVESGLFTFFFRLAQAYVWTKTKAFYQSCTLRFLIAYLEIELQLEKLDKLSIASIIDDRSIVSSVFISST